MIQVVRVYKNWRTLDGANAPKPGMCAHSLILITKPLTLPHLHPIPTLQAHLPIFQSLAWMMTGLLLSEIQLMEPKTATSLNSGTCLTGTIPLCRYQLLLFFESSLQVSKLPFPSSIKCLGVCRHGKMIGVTTDTQLSLWMCHKNKPEEWLLTIQQTGITEISVFFDYVAFCTATEVFVVRVRYQQRGAVQTEGM